MQILFVPPCFLLKYVNARALTFFLSVNLSIFFNKIFFASFLFFAGVFQISDGLQAAAMGALRGYKDTKWPMIINLISYWCIGMNLGYHLGFRYKYGAEGLWVGLITGLSVAGIMHLWRLVRIGNRVPEDIH